MPVYRISSNRLEEIPQTTFEDAGIRERQDLQRLLREQVEVIAPDTLVISEEFSEWESSSRRIDLLAVDKTGSLVVIELKRTQSGEHMELQSLRYAAMVSAMTFERAVDVYGKHLQQLGKDDDPEESLLSFLGWTEPDDEQFAKGVSIVLASANFSQELTTTVMWLTEQYGLDIRCMRLRPYKNNSEVLLEVEQVIPLPEASNYVVKWREKRSEERKTASKTEELLRTYWTDFIRLSRKRTQLHSNISPSKLTWITAGSGFGDVVYNCVLNKHRCFLELHIDRKDKAENKRIFDAFQAEANDIEVELGAKLKWYRQDSNRRSLVILPIADAGYADEEQWPGMQEKMVESLVKFENVFQPRIDRIKAGR